METVDMEQSLKDIEKDHIIAVLNRTHWHLGKACTLLGITRPTLRHKLKMYNKDIETCIITGTPVLCLRSHISGSRQRLPYTACGLRLAACGIYPALCCFTIRSN